MIIRPKIREGRGKVKIWFWVPKKKDMVLVLIKSKFSQYLIKSTKKKKNTKGTLGISSWSLQM